MVIECCFQISRLRKHWIRLWTGSRNRPIAIMGRSPRPSVNLFETDSVGIESRDGDRGRDALDRLPGRCFPDRGSRAAANYSRRAELAV